ncbi:ribosomal RNA small subunit methyltransferase A [Candidatus Falkowbacteria bacterium]|uniref:Ribosomal RNA small subunit methyltransferase A n=1 Tax=Candidatus Buchananbacteria bacterium CG10_big_fil_rev_8_21_14_0_10_33_19 TaxID=1974525 RepID=A0A2H0W4K0_9BACT|nr:ribosomal RNA small subunit methyltransferase A [Candidatus Falkowbacteria bacterium]PIS06276.1 MAG: ribosomal RNA small subunit methyltransferase A [Candidatus Buchananbacteria bacterium CG10_big_fil_rev_8_21_14_0_10_33_19]
MNLNEIKDVCQLYNIVPTKSKGQNFLFDENIIESIVKSANLNKKDTVLEIGPGLGVLTDYLIKEADQVVAVELDKKIISFLHKKYQSVDNLRIIEGDILKLDVDSLGLQGAYKIVANLPYNITSNFIRTFLEADNPPVDMTIMIQKEVAQRIIAQVGDMSLLSLAVQFYAEPKILFPVSHNSFWPAPKVDSAVINLKLKPKPAFDNPKLFFKVAKIGFSAKRKQLHNNLANGLHIASGLVKSILSDIGLNEKIRAQDLSINDWIKLIKKLDL